MGNPSNFPLLVLTRKRTIWTLFKPPWTLTQHAPFPYPARGRPLGPPPEPPPDPSRTDCIVIMHAHTRYFSNAKCRFGEEARLGRPLHSGLPNLLPPECAYLFDHKYATRARANAANTRGSIQAGASRRACSLARRRHRRQVSGAEGWPVVRCPVSCQL